MFIRLIPMTCCLYSFFATWLLEIWQSFLHSGDWCLWKTLKEIICCFWFALLRIVRMILNAEFLCLKNERQIKTQSCPICLVWSQLSLVHRYRAVCPSRKALTNFLSLFPERAQLILLKLVSVAFMNSFSNRLWTK